MQIVLICLVQFPLASGFFVGRSSSRLPSSWALPLRARLISTFDASDFQGVAGDWPYSEADLGRLDPSDDGRFYSQPRLVTHIDVGAIRSLTTYYQEMLAPSSDVLDLCSSWISHLPGGPLGSADWVLGRVEGLGMVEDELALNPQLTGYVAQVYIFSAAPSC
jgi:hypothetical protein